MPRRRLFRFIVVDGRERRSGRHRTLLEEEQRRDKLAEFPSSILCLKQSRHRSHITRLPPDIKSHKQVEILVRAEDLG